MISGFLERWRSRRLLSSLGSFSRDVFPSSDPSSVCHSHNLIGLRKTHPNMFPCFDGHAFVTFTEQSRLNKVHFCALHTGVKGHLHRHGVVFVKRHCLWSVTLNDLPAYSQILHSAPQPHPVKSGSAQFTGSLPMRGSLSHSLKRCQASV